MQEDGGRIKSVGKLSHQAFGHWVDKKLAEGWQIESCYEAGASGYWLHQHWKDADGTARSSVCVSPRPPDTGKPPPR